MNKRKLFQSKNYNAKNETKSSKFNLNNFGNKNYSKSKKQAGITLIALVISIIVMLILAGVSLNATIGDNGIITQAQNATYMQSVAALEEFMQQQYLNLYDTIEDPENKIDYFLNDVGGAKKYIQKAMNNNYYFMDSSTGNTYYFIEKSALPDEIKNQIKGGDTSLTDKTIWADFNDIYGITSDLKVYYCGSSSDTRIGATDESLKAELLSKPISGMSAGSAWAETLGINKDVTYKDVIGVDEITITNNNLDLKLMYNLGSLKKITFKDVEMKSLDGINTAINLNYVFFSNSKIDNYSSLGKCDKLNKLYFYFLSSMSEEDTNKQIANLCDENIGIAKANLKNLEYFGAFGVDYINYSVKEENITNNAQSSNLTDISPLNKLEAKKYIKYVFLNNNKFNSLSPLNDFTNLYQVKLANCKKLNSLEGLQNKNNLTYLYAQYCDLYNTSGLENCNNLYYLYLEGNSNLVKLNKLENSTKLEYIYANECAIGRNENSGVSSVEDGLASLKNILSLKYIDLTNNDLKRVEYLSNLINLNNLYLDANENIDGNSLLQIKNIIINCGVNSSIPSKYSLILLDDNTINLSLENQEINRENFILLKSKTKITRLDLQNVKILDNSGKRLSDNEFNEVVNEVLATLTEMQYLNLTNMEQLNNIKFVKNMPNLLEIIFYGTNVITGTNNDSGEQIGLELLENNSKLRTLGIDNVNIDLSKITSVIERLGFGWNYYPESFVRYQGLFVKNENIFQSLNKSNINLSQLAITYLQANNVVDLSNCTSLKRVALIYGDKYKFKAPNSIKYLSLDGQFLYGDYPEQLEEIYCVNNCLENNTLKKLAENCPNLKKIRTDNSYDISDLSMLENAKFSQTLEFLHLRKSNNNGSLNAKVSSIKGLKNYTNLKEIIIERGSVSDLSGVETMQSLVSLCLPQNKVTSLEALKNNINLQKLQLTDNRVYSLHGLENLKQLNYLDLQNNCLQDIIQYTDENNEIQTVRNLNIVKNLNKNNGGKLDKLLLSGNSNLTDFSEIKNLSWSSKNGF